MAESQLLQCRVCTESKKVTVSISKVLDLGTVASCLQTLTSVNILIDDGFPQFICIICYEDLQNCLTFRKKTIQSDQLFRGIEEEEHIKVEDKNEDLVSSEDMAYYEEELVFTNENQEYTSSDEGNFKHEIKVETNLLENSNSDIDDVLTKNPKVSKKKKKKSLVRYDKKMTKCCMCSMSFAREQLLVEHAKQVHPDGKVDKNKYYSLKHRFSCPFCNQKFWQKRFLLAHFEDPNYVEPNRHAKTASKRIKTEEIEPIVSTDEENVENLVKVETNLLENSNSDSDDGLSDNFDSEVLKKKRKKSLVRYDKKMTKCCMCSLSFTREQQLIEHVKKVHPNGIVDKNKFYSLKHRFACPFCNQKFWQKRFLIAHFHDPNYVEPKRHALTRTKTYKRVKSESRFMCTYCGADYSTKELLEVHEARIHSTETPYKCSECNKSFSHRKLLSRHKHRVHRNDQYT